MLVGLAAGLFAAPVILAPTALGPADGAIGRAIRSEVGGAPNDAVARFYRAHRYHPLWSSGSTMRPDAAELVSVLRTAGDDGLNPAAYAPDRLAGKIASAKTSATLARADVDLSRAYARYLADLHSPVPSAALRFADPGVRMPQTDPLAVLNRAAEAVSPATALAEGRRMNPIYLGLRQAFDAERDIGAWPDELRRLQVNLERARALPPDLGRRYILVNPARETLWFFDHGRATGVMKVVVGKPELPTPAMIGLIRYALLNPYWNVPPDLVRDRLARSALREGPDYLTRHGFQALSDWSAAPRSLDPYSIDWRAVADGSASVRVRQLPGRSNAMGHIKFMLPNPLGVYLHDTSERGLFKDTERFDSAGCVRVQYPRWLANWLLQRTVRLTDGGSPDQRLDLTEPVPVYILYLTAQATSQGLTFPPDIYGRDAAVASELAAMPDRLPPQT